MVASAGRLGVLVLIRLLFVFADTSLNNTQELENMDDLDYSNDTLDLETIFKESGGSINLSRLLTHEEDLGNYPIQEDIGNYSDPRETNDTLSQYSETDSMGSSTKVPNKCTVCTRLEDDRKFRIQALKLKILDKLHLHTPPNVTGKVLPKVPRLSRLIERSEFQNDSPDNYHDSYEYDETHSWHTQRLFVIAKTPPPDLILNETQVAYFPIPDELRYSKIKKAVLWYYMRPAKHQKTVVEVNIHKLHTPKSSEDPPIKTPLRYWKLFPKKATNWHQLDVLNTVQDWSDKPHHNYGLELTAFDHTNDNLIILPPTSSEEAGYEPLIEIKSSQKIYRRVRRNALRCPANSSETRCCRRQLTVNFVDFGWDWVIAPRTYEANYCAGECQFAMQDQTQHSYIQQQAITVGPCCTPTLLSALNLLYFDQNQLVRYTHLLGMKVDRCGCA